MAIVSPTRPVVQEKNPFVAELKEGLANPDNKGQWVGVAIPKDDNLDSNLTKCRAFTAHKKLDQLTVRDDPNYPGMVVFYVHEKE